MNTSHSDVYIDKIKEVINTKVFTTADDYSLACNLSLHIQTYLDARKVTAGLSLQEAIKKYRGHYSIDMLIKGVSGLIEFIHNVEPDTKRLSNQDLLLFMFRFVFDYPTLVDKKLCVKLLSNKDIEDIVKNHHIYLDEVEINGEDILVC